MDLMNGETIPRDFLKYIRDNIDSQGDDPGKDPWKTEWKTKGGPRNLPFVLISCGPDEKCGTDDDIEVVIVDESGRYQSSSG